VQVDPIKPTLKAPGTKRLTQKCDESLSNFAFNFNLRRYTSGNEPVFAFKAQNVGDMTIKGITVTDFRISANVYIHIGVTPGRAVQVDPIHPC